MSEAPETRQVSATRRLARTLARVPRNPSFGWILIGTGALLYLVAIFNTAVEFQTSPDRMFGWHSERRLDGWNSLWSSIAHLRALATGSACEYPRYKGWVALAGAANLILMIGLLYVPLFARTRRRCFPVALAVGLAAAGVIVTLVGVHFAGTLNGWKVSLADAAGLWGLAFLCVGVGVALRWLDLSPERIEKRKQEKMGRLERHGV